MRWNYHNYRAAKRGLRPLGTFISWLTDLPSPESYENYTELVDTLANIVDGNVKATHTITNTIKDITETTTNLSRDFEYVTEKVWKLKNELDIVRYYLEANHRLSNICNEASIIADDLSYEANIIEEIRQKSRQDRPSEHLFPLDDILLKLKFLEKKT